MSQVMYILLVEEEAFLNKFLLFPDTLGYLGWLVIL